MSQQTMSIVSIISSVPGVPGFTSMADGFVIPEFFDESLADGEFVFALTDDEKKRIAKLDANATTTPISLIDQHTNAAFQVTSGKTARVILVISVSNAISDVEIWESDTVDTADGTKLTTMFQIGIGNLITTSILEFAANKYITLKITTGSGRANLGSTVAYIAEEI